MFKRILVPLPMENIPKEATKRAGEVAEMFGSKVYVAYIIEDEVFKEVEKRSTHVITNASKDNFLDSLKDVHRKNAKDLIKKEVSEDLKMEPTKFLIREGSFHDVILDLVKEFDIDAVMMEYHSFDLVKYRIMDHSPVPIWIVRHKESIKKIGLFCTNLAPNTMAPSVAKELAEQYGGEVRSFYVCDDSGPEKKNESKLIEDREKLKFEKVVKGDLESELYRISRKEGLDLIVLGRVKKIGFFDLRSGFAKKTDCSVLLMN